MELFDLVNENGEVIGIAPRACCHGNPALRHRTAHVVVVSSDGRILLQKRSRLKDVQPGKWDTAVGGHVAHGESFLQAAQRELNEELGLPAETPLTQLFDMTILNDFESEITRVFSATSDGPFLPQPSEVDDVRFWSVQELKQAFGNGQLTPYLEHELALLFKHWNL